MPTHRYRTNSYPYFSDSYFDPHSLGQLGLAGMPDMLYSNEHTFSSDSPSQPYQSHQSASSKSSHSSLDSPQYRPLYPSINDQAVSYSPPNHEYISSDLRRLSPPSSVTPPASYTTQQPPLHHTQPASPNSTSLLSTPELATTPQIPDSTSSFDYIRPSRGLPPVPHLGPVDYTSKTMRTIVPLKAAPGTHTADSRPTPIEPKLPPPPYHGAPAKLTSFISSPSDLLYPLLRSGDIKYKLPPIQRIYRSPSPSMGESAPSSTASSPITNNTIVLPPLRSMSIAPPRRTSDSDDLAHEIDRIGLENRTTEITIEVRRKHAQLIQDLLVSINMDYKRRVGIPTSG